MDNAAAYGGVSRIGSSPVTITFCWVSHGVAKGIDPPEANAGSNPTPGTSLIALTRNGFLLLLVHYIRE
jgi:hypothetical protein